MRTTRSLRAAAAERSRLRCPGTFNGGGGGGVSQVFAEPSYQAAAVGSASGRLVPDISALADPNTGFLTGQTQTFSDAATEA
jgi:subtilase family serine protease